VFFKLLVIMGNIALMTAFFSFIGPMLSFLIAWIVFTLIRTDIRRLDRANGCLR
jgi:hypothetical protein